MDADRLGELDRYFADRAKAPFGDLELASGRTLQPFSIAGQRAASNLLVKAIRALDNGDAVRARMSIVRCDCRTTAMRMRIRSRWRRT